MRNKRIKYILLIAFVILIIPLTTMQFTNEVDWKLNDFIIAAILLFGTGVTIDFILRKIKNRKWRIVILIIFLLLLFLIWTQLAVGIFEIKLSGA